MSNSDPMLAEALRLAETGAAVHWLRKRSKAPIEKAWAKAPVNTADDLEDTFRDGYNVGVRLGQFSEVDGLFLHVLDLDVRTDRYAQEALDALHDLVGDTRDFGVVRSGSGGESRHFYFLADQAFRSRKIAHSQGKYTDADGKSHWHWEIELFGTGKQVAAPPSIHPDTGKPYEWLHELDPETVCEIDSKTITGWTNTQPESSSDDAFDDLDYVVGRLNWSEKKLRSVLYSLDHDEFCEDREGWLKVGMALHHETGGSKEGLDLWHEFSSESGKYEPEYLDERWPGFGRTGGRPVRFVTLVKAAGMTELLRYDDEQDEDIGPDPEDMPDEDCFFKPYRSINPADIPRRQWLYGTAYIRSYLGVTVAPGGVGKSTLTITEGLAMASGTAILDDEPKDRLRVAIWNLEDGLEEIERRVAAARLHHGLTHDDLEDYLYLNGSESKLVVASETRDGVKVARPLIKQLIRAVKREEIDVIVVDPFVSSHTVSENSNNAISAVADIWRDVARKCNVAVHLVHHVRKSAPGMNQDFSADDARGAKALTDAARSVRVLNRMKKEEAEKFGIGNPWAFVRVDDGKANLAPPSEKAVWRHLTGYKLPNHSDELDDGDNVGVIEAWEPREAEIIEFGDAEKIVSAMGSYDDWRPSPRSTKGTWIGEAVAQALGFDGDDKDDRKKISRIIKCGFSEGWLDIVERKDDNYRTVRCVVPGKIEQENAVEDFESIEPDDLL